MRLLFRFLPGLLLIAVLGDCLGHYLLPTLLALGLIVGVLRFLARKRGWGSEGRLTRYLGRPRFIEESKRLCIDPEQGANDVRSGSKS
jgi:hypothetical protein